MVGSSLWQKEGRTELRGEDTAVVLVTARLTSGYAESAGTGLYSVFEL